MDKDKFFKLLERYSMERIYKSIKVIAKKELYSNASKNSTENDYNFENKVLPAWLKATDKCEHLNLAYHRTSYVFIRKLAQDLKTLKEENQS